MTYDTLRFRLQRAVYLLASTSPHTPFTKEIYPSGNAPRSPPKLAIVANVICGKTNHDCISCPWPCPRRPQSGHGWRRSRPLLGTDHGAICLHCCSLYTTSTPSASSAQWGKACSTSLPYLTLDWDGSCESGTANLIQDSFTLAGLFKYSQMGCATSTKLRVPPWLRLSPPTIVPPVPHGVGVVHPNSELLSAATVP
ncbi:predicted protein [Plenodomus lingam JN3]|uniref:Predicted protein n=1 Tax=Leptosphaeria maculans (strain JN3 / isolate v23.1.3 / race Av1-4-5-6-7-8) TaxID=985895 RepID=E5AAL4_LEPMJ|nr:predicted protein [Plenodomus lingam JN3]CBY00705.1 predicted protein [Plenodomus lingam JN3]